MLLSRQSNWIDSKTRPIYIYMKILTSDLKTDWKWGNEKRSSMQMDMKRNPSSYVYFWLNRHWNNDYKRQRRTFQFQFQFSCSVVSNSLQPHEPQPTRPPCPSPTRRVYPNPCPLSQWCHPTISSSVIPFSSCPQSFPASRSFQVSQLFASGGWSIGVSASTSFLPVNTQDCSPFGWIDWVAL